MNPKIQKPALLFVISLSLCSSVVLLSLQMLSPQPHACPTPQCLGFALLPESTSPPEPTTFFYTRSLPVLSTPRENLLLLYGLIFAKQQIEVSSDPATIDHKVESRMPRDSASFSSDCKVGPHSNHASRTFTKWHVFPWKDICRRPQARNRKTSLQVPPSVTFNDHNIDI